MRMSPFSAVTGNRKGLRNLQIREDRQPSDEKSHPLDLSVVCAKSFCCSDDSWKKSIFREILVMFVKMTATANFLS